MQKGLIHIYTGDGKGKTTAAFGLAMRASGRGKKVLWTSFLKDYNSGEFMHELPFEVVRGEPVHKFWFTMTDDEKAAVRDEHTSRLRSLFERCTRESVDLLILDETLGSLSVGALSEDDVVSLLQSRPEGLEVVLTGRSPSERLVELADYVSELVPRKNPYDKGIPSREGIEY